MVDIMALDYTVNWVEQGRNPVTQEDNTAVEVLETEHQLVLSNGRYLRQSRTRKGTTTYTAVKTLCDITYKATTVTEDGVTSAITEEQSADIQADAYSGGCQSCTTAHESGPTFSVTKVVRDATALVSTTTKTTEWEDWGDWQPTLAS